MIENEEEKLLKRLNKVIDECIVIYNKYEITDEELAALSASHIANMLLRSGCKTDLLSLIITVFATLGQTVQKKYKKDDLFIDRLDEWIEWD